MIPQENSQILFTTRACLLDRYEISLVPQIQQKPTALPADRGFALIRGYAEGYPLLKERNEASPNGDSLRLSALVKIKQSLTFATVRAARRGVEDAEHPTG